MPGPTSSTTVQRPDLGQVAYEYALTASQRGFIGNQVMPVFEVARQSGNFPKIPTEALLKMPDVKRNARGRYNRGDWEFEMDNYSCVESGWEEPLDDVEARLYSRFFDSEIIATQRAVDIILRAMEKRIADAVFNSVTFTATAITHEWDDATNAVPATNVKAGKISIKEKTGLNANALIIAYSTFLDLNVADDVIGRIKYVYPGVTRGNIGVPLLAQYFDVDYLLIGDAVYDSAKKGQSQSISSIWSNEYAMLCRIAPPAVQDIKDPCIGRTFLWSQDSPDEIVTESYREEQTRSNIYRCRQQTDEKVLFTGAAYLMKNVTT